VGILDADKEGLLRSYRSLIQTIGRAARNAEGRALLYADRITDSMKEAIEETARRRKAQSEYNEVHGIVPASIQKEIRASVVAEEVRHSMDRASAAKVALGTGAGGRSTKSVWSALDSAGALQDVMKGAVVSELDRTDVAHLWDEIKKLAGEDFRGPDRLDQTIAALQKRMKYAARELDFETAAELRDRVRRLRELSLRAR